MNTGIKQTSRSIVEWLKVAAAILIVIPILIYLLFDAVAWTRSWFDRVDYEAELSAIPAVIEKVAKCSPCKVERIEVQGHKMWFVASDGEGRVWEYQMRDKYLADVESLNWKSAGESEARSFDPRADLDIEILRQLLRELGDASVRPNHHQQRLTISRFFGASRPICIQRYGISKTADGGPC